MANSCEAPTKDGSRDHRRNKGDDRTPAQKDGDKKKKKD